MTTGGEDEAVWYVRRGSSLLGPYSRADLERYILLGRIRLADRVSTDGRSWTRLGEREDLIPASMKDLDTPEGRARFEAARREADERASGHEPRPGGRRADDPGGARLRVALSVAGGVLLMVIIALVAIGWHLDFTGTAEAQPDCAAAAAPGVDWSYCVLVELELPRGADLSGLVGMHTTFGAATLHSVVLRGARLMHADLAGADLREADLDNANLEGADLRRARLRGASLVDATLRHADLRDTDLAGVDLSGADLSGAAWSSGEWCRDGSIGECVR